MSPHQIKVHPADGDAVSGVALGGAGNDLVVQNLLEGELDEQLLRGISSHHVMAGHGAVFRTNKNSKEVKKSALYEQKKADYENSVPAQELHSFLSHAWVAAQDQVRIGCSIALAHPAHAGE